MLKHLGSEAVFPERVVVIGAAGFVGGAVCARLARDGVPVLRLHRAEIDLGAPDAAAQLTRHLRAGDSVVCAAAKAPCKTPEMLVENIVMTRTLTKALAATAVAHVVNISSDAVYADSAEPLTERSCAAPDSVHGVMHVAREVCLRAESKAPLATLRPTLIFGPGDPHNGYGPNRFRRQAARGEDIVLFGAGEERRDHIFIDDVAEIVAQVIYRRSAGVLNVATGRVSSFHELAEAVAETLGCKVRIKVSPRSGPLPHNGYRAFDIAALRTAFPAFAFTPLEEALRLSQSDVQKANR